MIKFAGHNFVLDPDRAVHWPDCHTLIVADLHFGKAAIFRENGLPVPAGTTAGDLWRLDRLIARTQPRRLLILGDCFHGKMSDPSLMHEQLREWRRGCDNVAVELICGNHDRRANETPADLEITIHAKPLEEKGIIFSHEPLPDATVPTMCGHIHPAASLRDFDGHCVRLPCFVVEDRQMTLPAFGGFTGTHTLTSRPGRRLYVAAQGRVLLVDTALGSAAGATR